MRRLTHDGSATVGPEEDAPLLTDTPILIASLVAATVAYVSVVIALPWLADREGQDTFRELPEFAIWSQLVAVVAALSVAVLLPVWRWLHELRPTFAGAYYRGARTKCIAAYLVFLVVLLVPQALAVIADGGTLTGSLRWVPTATIVVPALVLAPAGIGMWSVARGAATRPLPPLSTLEIERFRLVRSRLKAFLVTAGTLVALGMITTSSMLNAVTVFAESDPSIDAPRPEVVLLYGAFMTALLALLYLPAHAALERRGRCHVKDIAPAAFDPNDSGLMDASEKAERISELLGLGTSAWASFQTSVVIVAPLISGLFAFFRV